MIRTSSISITSQILNLIAELDEFKGRWDMLGRLAPDKLTSLKRVATIESVGSSTRIEGARLSDLQVEALLANLEMRPFRSRDEEEVAGYAEAMNTLHDSWEYIPFTENHIKQLHGITLKYSTKDAAHRGEYKTLPNNVEAFDADGRSIGVIFETASPFDTPRLMAELVSGTVAALREGELHPLLVIGAFVVHFLAIHPFQDGNGRLSRVLTTLLLLQSGYRHVPYSSLERIVEENKDGYYRALRASQKLIRSEEENLDNWLRFFLTSLKKQKDVLLGKIEREQLLEKLAPLEEKMLAIARERGRITIADAVTLLAANRNTVKLHLRQLVQQGYLEQHGTGKGTWYSVGR
ncbi:Fic family protein [Geotalea uraniireducens]|uniref:Filamentation induced by cAMP protein Fic n=1 Tax=Geotalea uraniireducens (strain Rf4) TaxID=351605 RepID=A5GAB3_GEOUR|nr:Fic family protein [Geotalea uraniireducens]ABQ25482.1 filamentation induced by cAMP protein Fic [Geotalea uraniireducens Rf4]